MDYLLDKREYECVGAYYRNQYMSEWELMEEVKRLKISSIIYNRRNLIEGFHGYVKKYLNHQSFANKFLELIMQGRICPQQDIRENTPCSEGTLQV